MFKSLGLYGLGFGRVRCFGHPAIRCVWHLKHYDILHMAMPGADRSSFLGCMGRDRGSIGDMYTAVYEKNEDARNSKSWTHYKNVGGSVTVVPNVSSYGM